MEINRSRDGDKLVLELSGKLDTTTAPELSEVLENETEGVKELEFNLKDLIYISSAGLRVLLTAYKKMQAAEGGMIVRNSNADVRETFKITGFDRTLGIK